MNLFERQTFESHIGRLPSVEIVHQWGDASVGKIGGKIFAILSTWTKSSTPAISFKCSDMGFTLLPDLKGVSPAPYLARAKWVEVLPGSELTDAELKAYIEEAHRLVAARLTRQARHSLGLEA